MENRELSDHTNCEVSELRRKLRRAIRQNEVLRDRIQRLESPPAIPIGHEPDPILELTAMWQRDRQPLTVSIGERGRKSAIIVTATDTDRIVHVSRGPFDQALRRSLQKARSSYLTAATTGDFSSFLAGQRLANTREKLGLTQRDAAKLLDTEQPRLSALENGLHPSERAADFEKRLIHAHSKNETL